MSSTKPEVAISSEKGANSSPSLSPTPSSFNSDSATLHKVTYTAEEEAAVVRKIDWALVPGLTFLYLLSFLDRSNVGNAKLLGLLEDIGITDQADYNTSLALYFLGYVLFEVPAQAVLKRLNPKIWIPTLVVAWGIVATLQALVTNRNGFFAARFFMGVSEAGLFPGCIFVFSMYYRRSERHWRVACFFGGAAIAGAFGGVLAWGIGHMTNVGGLKPWGWIFALEGLFTVVVGISAFWWVPRYPREASFLNDREKDVLLARLAADGDAADREEFAWTGVLAAFKDHLVIAYALLFFGFAFPLYSLSLFLPTIIAGLGYKSWQAQLLTTPPYAVAALGIFCVAYGAHKTQRRGVWIVGSGVVGILGYIVLLTTHTPGARYVGIFFAVLGIYCANALLLSWPSENVSPQTKRATASGIQIFIGDTGAIAGVLIYRPSLNANFFRVPHIIALAFTVFGILVATYLSVIMSRANQQRAATLASRGKEEGPVEKDGEGGKRLGDRHLTYVYQI